MAKRNPKVEPAAGTGYPPIVERTWAAWEALRTLGFASEDIYVLTANGGQVVFVSLVQGEREFNIEIAHLGAMSVERFEEVWTRFAEENNAGKFALEVMMPIFHRWVRENGGATNLVMALTAKGIVLPLPPELADA